MGYQAPGVYINYVTAGPLTIRAASTSTAVFVGTTPVGGSIAEGTDAIEPVLVTSDKEYASRFVPLGSGMGAVTLPTKTSPATDHMGHAVAGFFGNRGAKAYIVSTKKAGTAQELAAQCVVEFTGTAASDTDKTTVRFVAVSKGTWGNDVIVTAKRSAVGRGFVDLEIGLDYGNGVKKEGFLGLDVRTLTSLRSSIVTIAVDAGTATGTLDTGDTAAAPITCQLAGGAASPESGKSMQEIFDALKDIDDISLILLPGRSWNDATDKADYTIAISHAQDMKDRMVLIQMPDTVPDWANTGLPVTQFAAAYYPNALVATKNGAGAIVTEAVGLTGHVAGVIARTDNDTGPWTSAAGTHAYLGGVAGLTRSISQVKQEPINSNNVNAVRYIQGMPTVFGARTRHVAGIYEYQAVMRTAFLIADSLRATLSQAVFAKNTEVLWGNLKLAVSGFLQGLYAQGAFQGASPSQAFEVACGLGESMTQAEIDTGLLRVTVRFRPAKPAEFIEVSIEQLFADSL